MRDYRYLELEFDAGVLYVWLNRPDVRNAFNADMIREISDCFGTITSVPDVRAVMLGGRGAVFCAGADLDWMYSCGSMTEAENYLDAQKLAGMLALVDACPYPLVGRVQKAAVGGALGLMACCDSVICTTDCRFAFGEARLGISPATIAPYVTVKIGIGHARNLFLSGERFMPEHAFAIGLVHSIVKPNELDEVVEAKLSELLMAGPAAARATKQLLRHLVPPVSDVLREEAAHLIAQLRVSPEGQEGLKAFIEKRAPSWQTDV